MKRIKGFFGHGDHEILMRLVCKVVKDRRVLGLVCGWLRVASTAATLSSPGGQFTGSPDAGKLLVRRERRA
ncbi:MAG: hypothetical protein ACE5OR_16715 [bacterium]